MKEEITEEVKELLDSLERHGQNAHRQKELSDLIDYLEASGTKQRKLYPIWWIVGAAAACLLLWLQAKPTIKETPNINEEILVEEKENVVIEQPIILEESMVPEELLAEETPITVKKPQLAENTAIETTKTETIDTSNIGSNPIPPIENHLPPPTSHLSPSHSPQRRVIRSLNLVCYECQKEPEYMNKTNYEDKTIFGQPQDPNMKNGSLAFEVKLY